MSFSSAENYAGKAVHVSGWGLTNEGDVSEKLLSAKLTGATLDICRSHFKEAELSEDYHMCASDDKQDVCNGDSGGEDAHFF